MRNDHENRSITKPSTKNPMNRPNAVESAFMSSIAESVCLFDNLLNNVFLEIIMNFTR